MPYLVGFSGPPRSGKDSIANELAGIIRVCHPRTQVAVVALSMPLRLAIYALGGMAYNQYHYEANKDQPQEVFGGATIRQAMIALAEEHIRPRYGREFYARSMLNRYSELNAPDVILITDLGFHAEADYLAGELGDENCVWAQIDRPEHDFRNDSRGYVGRGGQQTMVCNLGTDKAQIDECAGRLYERLVNRFGWKLT